MKQEYGAEIQQLNKDFVRKWKEKTSREKSEEKTENHSQNKSELEEVQGKIGTGENTVRSIEDKK